MQIEEIAMYEEIIEKLRDIIEDELGIDKKDIMETSKIASDLDVNSLELLNVIMVIEEDFEITLEESRLRKLKTVGDIANYIVGLKA